jgi:hypothetical protein
MSEVALLVASYDGASDLWPLVLDRFSIHKNECFSSLYILTNNIEVKNEDWINIRTGDDKGFSANLIRALDGVKEEYVVVWVDDLILTGPINHELFLSIVSHTLENNIKYVNIWNNYPHSYADNTNLEIGPLPQDIKYRIGMGIGLWDKQFLKELLKNEENAWHFERNAQTRVSENDKEKIYAVKRDCRPFKVHNTLIKGRVNWFSKKKVGFQNPIRRSYISIFDYTYIQLYRLRLKVFIYFKYHWR